MNIDMSKGPTVVAYPVHDRPPPAMSQSPASTAPVSRLQQMQARFQQRQQQVKEQKLLALYAEQAHQAYGRINNGGGRVRQLFQERRGLDRSYPLQPLAARRGTSLDRGQQLLKNNINKNNGQVRGAPPRYPSAGYECGDDDYYLQPTHLFASQLRLDLEFPAEKNNQFINNNQSILNKQQPEFGDDNDYTSKFYDLVPTKLFNKLPNIGGVPLSEQKLTMPPAKDQDVVKKSTSTINPHQLKTSRNNVDAGVKSVTKSMAKLTPPSKKPEVKAVKNSETKPKLDGVRRPTPVPVTNKIASRPASASSLEKEKLKSDTKMASKSTSSLKAKSSIRSTNSVGNSDLIACKFCGRNFAGDRIAAHQEICAKTSSKKRKPFDPLKQRLSGTGAEKYLRKGKPPPPPANTKKSNWRKKHEEFISNIRAAKEAQAHVAAGGKLSDLPPPPPLDTSDYTQCPYCGRKFNESAAARHIPKCKTMLHNKPKQSNPSTSRNQDAKKRY